jgi:hypothetical protein
MDRNTLRQLDYWEEVEGGPNSAIQHGQIWLTTTCTIDVEVRLKSPES